MKPINPVALVESADPVTADARVMLVPFEEIEGLQKQYPLFVGSVTIGRKATCDLAIPEVHAYVSGEHCRIDVAQGSGRVTLEDMSANGTYVNSSRFSKNRAKINSLEIHVGDEISLAKPSRKGGAIRFILKAASTDVSNLSANADVAPPADILFTAAAAAVQSLPMQLAQSKLPVPATAMVPPQVARVGLAEPAFGNLNPTRLLDVKVPSATPSLLPQAAHREPEPAMAPQAHVPLLFNSAVQENMLARTALHRSTSGNACTPAAVAHDSVPAPIVAHELKVTPPVLHAAVREPVESFLLARYEPASASRMLVAALVGHQQQTEHELASLLAQGEEEAARMQTLTSELREVRAEHVEMEEDRRRRRHGQARGASADGALLDGNLRAAAECEELREQLARIREDTARLERSRPIVEEAAARERKECAQLRAQLDTEQECAAAAEAETSALRSKVEADTSRAMQLRDELSQAAVRNASLEEQCAEANAERSRTQESATAARERLSDRTRALATLKGAMREHARRLSERLGTLDQALLEVSSQDDSPGLDLMGIGVDVHRTVSHALHSDVQPSARHRAIWQRAGGLEDGGGTSPRHASSGPAGGRASAVAGHPARSSSRCVIAGGVEVKIDSSSPLGTPTQGADVAAGVGIANAGAGSVGARVPISADGNPGKGLSPAAKRRRLPSMPHDIQGARRDASIGKSPVGENDNRLQR